MSELLLTSCSGFRTFAQFLQEESMASHCSNSKTEAGREVHKNRK